MSSFLPSKSLRSDRGPEAGVRGIPSPFINLDERGRDTPHPSFLPLLPMRKDLLARPLGIFGLCAAAAGRAPGPRTRGSARLPAQFAPQLRGGPGRNGAEPGFNGRKIRLWAAHMGFERLPHDAQVL